MPLGTEALCQIIDSSVGTGAFDATPVITCYRRKFIYINSEQPADGQDHKVVGDLPGSAKPVNPGDIQGWVEFHFSDFLLFKPAGDDQHIRSVGNEQLVFPSYTLKKMMTQIGTTTDSTYSTDEQWVQTNRPIPEVDHYPASSGIESRAKAVLVLCILAVAAGMALGVKTGLRSRSIVDRPRQL